MKLFQTDRGLARQDGDALAILDIAEADLDAVLANGRLEAMRDAATRDYVGIVKLSVPCDAVL